MLTIHGFFYSVPCRVMPLWYSNVTSRLEASKQRTLTCQSSVKAWKKDRPTCSMVASRRHVVMVNQTTHMDITLGVVVSLASFQSIIFLLFFFLEAVTERSGQTSCMRK